VVRQANAQLAPHQRIQGWTVWPDGDFPRTHTLKVKRQDVLQALVDRQDGRKRESTTVAAREGDALTPLERLIAETTNAPRAAVRPDATLEADLGLDSLGRVELLAAVEAELGVYLDESRVEPTTTVADLQRMITAQQAGARPTFARWPLTGPAMGARKLLQVPAFAALDFMAPARVRGTDLLKELTPPALFVANHISHADAPVLLKAIPAGFRERVAVAAADDYFFTPRRRWWLGIGVEAVLNAFPFSRTTAIRPTLEHCAYLLDHGWSILIFPEGTRTDTGEIGRFKGGAGLLAVELEVPVVSCRIEGIENVLPKHGYVPHRAPITVSFGRPIRFARGTPYDEASAAIEDAVRAL
jgi:long-chain acyl-CoA synthetase